MAADLSLGASPISLQGVSKVFETKDGTIRAVDGVTLDIEPGSFVSIVGPSGCGKTTLLRMMAGLVEPTRGSIRIGDSPVELGTSDVGMVFQQATLLPWKTVRENVVFPSKLQNKSVREARRRAEDLLELVHLKGFEAKYPAELSGGMQQRVSICRALIEDPSVMLMDEPFGALDAMTREHLNVELERLWLERRKSVVFVTHSISEAVLLSDRVVVMSPRPGRITDVVDIPLSRPRDLDQLASAEGARIQAAIRSHFSRADDLVESL